MISTEDIRWAIAYLDPARLARAAWRAADGDTSAAVGLDLAMGELAVLTWRAGSEPPCAGDVLVLVYCPAHRRADTRRALSERSEVAPSEEVVGEMVVRRGAVDGVFWPAVEVQLARAARAA